MTGLPFLLLASAFTLQSASSQSGSDSTPVLALVGGRIYPSPQAAPIDTGVLLIRGELITAVGPRDSVSVPASARVVDCSGSTIVAGFWNSHVHFTEPHWAGADTLPAPQLTHQFRRMFAQYGFVRVLEVHVGAMPAAPAARQFD